MSADTRVTTAVPDSLPATYRTVLVGHRGDELSADALALARLLAQATAARLLVACVAPPTVAAADGPWLLRDRTLRERAESEARLEGIELELEPDIDVETRLVDCASVPRGLHSLAEAEAADLIVLGSSRHGRIGRVLLGSVASRLIHGAPCAVAVAPRGFAATSAALDRIAVAFDGSPESKVALHHAAVLARAAGARLRLIAAVEPVVFPAFVNVPTGDAYVELMRSRREYLEGEIDSAARAQSPGIGVETRVIEANAVDGICKGARYGVDLLVVGSRGWGPAKRVLLGSVSSRLLNMAEWPLVVVPRGADVRDGTRP